MKKRKGIIYEEYALLPLTKGYFAKVDKDDLLLLEKYNWRVVEGKSVNYARTTYTVDGKKKSVYMHKLIMDEYNDTIDHINLEGLDNRRVNLRKVSFSENSQNSKHRCNNKSGYKGVTWNEDSKKWLVQIGYKRKRIHVGYFNDLLEAHEAYQEASKKYHGKFGRV